MYGTVLATQNSSVKATLSNAMTKTKVEAGKIRHKKTGWTKVEDILYMKSWYLRSTKILLGNHIQVLIFQLGASPPATRKSGAMCKYLYPSNDLEEYYRVQTSIQSWQTLKGWLADSHNTSTEAPQFTFKYIFSLWSALLVTGLTYAGNVNGTSRWNCPPRT